MGSNERANKADDAEMTLAEKIYDEFDLDQERYEEIEKRKQEDVERLR